MPWVLLPPAGGFPPVQFPSKGVGIVLKPCYWCLSPQVAAHEAESAFNDSDIKALDFVKDLDLTPLVANTFLAETTNKLLDFMSLKLIHACPWVLISRTT